MTLSLFSTQRLCFLTTLLPPPLNSDIDWWHYSYLLNTDYVPWWHCPYLPHSFCKPLSHDLLYDISILLMKRRISHFLLLPSECMTGMDITTYWISNNVKQFCFLALCTALPRRVGNNLLSLPDTASMLVWFVVKNGLFKLFHYVQCVVDTGHEMFTA